MRVLIIVNPSSGGSEAGLYDFARTLGLRGIDVVMRFLCPGQSVAELLNDTSGFDRIVAAGGDGTVSAVLYATRYSGIPVLAYPAGTANLLALNLDLPMDPVSLADITVDGRILSFDLGQIASADASDESSATGFAIMAGAGYDAAIMETATPWKSTFGAAAYLMAAVANLAPTTAKFRLVLDGEHIETEGIAVLLVNFGRIQFDIQVAPRWDAQDGLLDVVVVRKRNAAELIPVMFSAMFERLGEVRDRIGIDTYRAREVSIDASPDLRIQSDGDARAELTPIRAKVLPGAATLLVPQHSPHARRAAEKDRARD